MTNTASQLAEESGAAAPAGALLSVETVEQLVDLAHRVRRCVNSAAENLGHLVRSCCAEATRCCASCWSRRRRRRPRPCRPAVIAGILDRGGLARSADEVWLFDALYGQTDSFLSWADATHGRLLNIYTDHGGTKEESENLRARLAARGTPLLASEETALTADALERSQYVFVHTDLGHNDVLAKRSEFTLFLRTSLLAGR